MRRRSPGRAASPSRPSTPTRRTTGSRCSPARVTTVYYPFTSLKYHALLVAVLLDNYCAGHEFRDRALVVDPAGEIVLHRTVYAGDDFALRIAPTDDREAFDVRTVDHGQVVGRGTGR